MKNYILDTNVLLHNPDSLMSFRENNVLIPIEVIEEIDKFKRESSELGQNARAVSRTLDELRIRGRLSEGVPLSNHGCLKIIFLNNGVSPLNKENTDNRILSVALALKKENPNIPTVVVSKDINLRIKADALGVQAEDYETDRVRIQDLYTGTFELEVTPQDLIAFRNYGELEIKKDVICCPNEYCALIDKSSPKRVSLAKVDQSMKKFIAIYDFKEGAWGIKPKNREQHFALDALMDDRIKLVTLMGKAGTGKTLLAIAAGLKCAVQDRQYRRLIVARPTVSVGKEIGFLPGTLEEKLDPWMQPIHDALELLADLNMGKDFRHPSELMRSGTIVVEALSYIRGRSIANQYMIIDEAQNLTPLEVKTIITRVGNGTKIVFTGDPYQIDNPYVDSSTNGFNYLVSKFRKEAISAHIELQHGERSELAELAANIL